jgi:GNAT superfamily N-acetyltransferase
MSALALRSKAFWGYAPEVLDTWRDELMVRAEQLAAHTGYVLESGDRIGAAALVQQAIPRWRLDALWVDPDCIGRGLGGRLLKVCLEHAGKEGGRGLLIDADPNAAAFYARCGARIVTEVSAPIAGAPLRVRPQMVLDEWRDRSLESGPGPADTTPVGGGLAPSRGQPRIRVEKGAAMRKEKS